MRLSCIIGVIKMLDSFRNNMRGIATVIVVFIGGIFAFTGTGSLFVSGVGADTALVVNGEKVSALVVQQATRQQRNRILQANEGLDPAVLDDELLRPQVIKDLIDRKVIAQTAQGQGMAISSKAVSELLVETAAFQTDGKFDQDQFQYAIRNLGYTTATFIEDVKEDLVIQQFVQGLSQSSFVTALEISTLAGFTEQARDYYYLTLPVAPIMDAVQLNAEDISAYYESNKTQYLTDAQVVVDYIELNAALLSDDVTVSSAQIQARFDEEAESANLGVSRHAAHILLESPDEDALAQIQADLDAGKDFADLAKQYSEDIGSADGGGDLGYTSGATFPEAFEVALALLEVGQVSGAVETDAGMHFIKLLDVQTPTFELVAESSRIAEDLKQEMAGSAMVEKLELLKEMSFNAESLAEVAADLDLTVQVSDGFSDTGGVGITSYPAVIKAAFSDDVLKDKYTSEVIALGDDRYVVIKLNQYLEARQKELSEVSDSVTSALVLAAAQQAIASQGAALLAQVEEGASVESSAKSNDLDWQVALGAKRSSGQVDVEILNAMFQLPAPVQSPVTKGFYMRNGDYVVGSLHQVVQGDVTKMSAQQKASLVYGSGAMVSGREVEAYQVALFTDAEVVQ